MTDVRIDAENLPKHLETLGYRLTSIGELTWRTYLGTETRRWPLLVRAHAGYVTFAIVPLVRTPEDTAQAAELYAEMLRLNHVLLMAKLSIDDDLDVVLSVEYPLASLDPSEVDDALAALGHYTAEHGDRLRAMAGA